MGYTLLLWISLSLTALPTGYGQEPMVTIRSTQPATFKELNGNVYQKVINAIRVQDVTLSCYVEDLGPDMLVRWRKTYTTHNGDVGQVFISTDLAITDNTKYSIEKPTEYTWRLRIRDIQIWDEGMYECYVQLTELSVARDSRIVRVLVPPYLTPAMVSPDTSVTEGEDINLLCNATGRPEPMIEWTRLGGAVLPNGMEKHMGGILPITNVRAKDRGEYRCRVWNSIGKIKRDIILDVNFKPIVTTGNNAVVYQAPGYSTTLQCFVEANPMPQAAEMKWVKGRLSYTVSTEKFIIRTIEGAFNRLTYEMIIDGVSEEDYGTYTCQISNSLVDGPPILQNVRLAKSSEPVPSPKVGRLVKAGEWERRFRGLNMRTSAGRSCFVISITTTIMCLATFMLQM